MPNNSPQENIETVPSKKRIRRTRLWVWLTLAAVLAGGGMAAMNIPVRLNNRSEVRVPLINYIKYKLFVTPRTSLKAHDPVPQPLDRSIEIPPPQCPEYEVCADV